MQIEALDTPVVLVDLDILEANVRRVADVAAKAGVALRPHTKTHKSSYIAGLQVAAGARGITVAKLGEAEAMADAGFTDILVAYPLVGRPKLERLAALMRRGVRVLTSMDDPVVAQGVSAVGESLGARIPVYLEVDTGLGRLGRLSGPETVALGVELARFPGLDVCGLMSHAGQAYVTSGDQDVRAAALADAEQMHATAEALRAQGVAIREISIGHTAGARFVGEMVGVTEMRPGIYVFNDRFAMMAGAAAPEQCAMRILATVVARPAPDRAVIDAGTKVFAADRHPDGLFGFCPERPELRLERLSEEHGVIQMPPETQLAVGDLLTFIPNHSCPVANLTDTLVGVRNERVERMIEVEGRGRVR